MNDTGQQWQVEQVLALAPRPSSVAAAQPLAVPSRWAASGCDDRAVWGRCIGTSAEPYDTVVDHVEVAFRCTCPSRAHPCKHAMALLLLWVRGQVPHGEPSGFITSWLARRVTPSAAPEPIVEPAPDAERPTAVPEPLPAPPIDPTSSRDDRVARMRAGLADLDRWIDDRIRTGLADPSLSRYATWDDLAARLVDAQVGGLANRVRRLAGLVGNGAHWHGQVLAELGQLHLLATAGRHLPDLPPHVADSVAVALGWQVRQADVLAGVPDTDHWVVMGRSDTREDRIEVRRFWLRGAATERWAMLLSFAAYGQSLDDSLVVGGTVHADLFRYPGALGLRALLGPVHERSVATTPPRLGTVRQACDAVGAALAIEPWIERYPLALVAAPTLAAGARGWVLTDATGSLPLVPDAAGLGTLIACSGGAPLALACEWTPAGLVPLTAHLPDRAIDLGPVAEASFVRQAS